MREVYSISKVIKGYDATVTVYSNWSRAMLAMERELLNIYEDIFGDLVSYSDIDELKEDLKDLYIHRNMDGDIVRICYGLTRIDLTVADFDDKE